MRIHIHQLLLPLVLTTTIAVAQSGDCPPLGERGGFVAGYCAACSDVGGIFRYISESNRVECNQPPTQSKPVSWPTWNGSRSKWQGVMEPGGPGGTWQIGLEYAQPLPVNPLGGGPSGGAAPSGNPDGSINYFAEEFDVRSVGTNIRKYQTFDPYRPQLPRRVPGQFDILTTPGDRLTDDRILGGISPTGE